MGQGDALGASVVGIRPPFQVAEALELPEQVVQGLPADPHLNGEVGRPRALRAGVLEDRQMGSVKVSEALLVQPFEHVLLHRLPGETEECADERRPGRPSFSQRVGKGT